MTAEISYFMRRFRSKTFSIESLYENVYGPLSDGCEVTVSTCRNLSTSPWPHTIGARHAWLDQGRYNHIHHQYTYGAR